MNRGTIFNIINKRGRLSCISTENEFNRYKFTHEFILDYCTNILNSESGKDILYIVDNETQRNIIENKINGGNSPIYKAIKESILLNHKECTINLNNGVKLTMYLKDIDVDHICEIFKNNTSIVFIGDLFDISVIRNSDKPHLFINDTCDKLRNISMVNKISIISYIGLNLSGQYDMNLNFKRLLPTIDVSDNIINIEGDISANNVEIQILKSRERHV